MIWRINYHALLIELDETGEQRDNLTPLKKIENAIYDICQSKHQAKYI